MGKKDWISVCEKGFFHLSVFLFPFSIYGNGSAFFASLTSGLPMVRQNGFTAKRARRPTTLSASFPEKPGSRKAGKPKKPKGRKPGKPGAEKAEMPIGLKSGRLDETSCAFTLYYRHAAMPHGMPRHSGHVAPRTSTSRVLSSLFSSQSFAFA